MEKFPSSPPVSEYYKVIVPESVRALYQLV